MSASPRGDEAVAAGLPWSAPLAVLAAPPPTVTEAEACAIVASRYGFAVEATPLRSERDQNFLLRRDDGARFVFKVSNAAQEPGVAAFQTRALLHIAAVAPQIAVPRPVATREGAWEAGWPAQDGTARSGRLVTFVSGTPLGEVPRTAHQAAALGRLAARLDRALRGFFDPAAGHPLLWDLKHAGAVTNLVPLIADQRTRELAGAALSVFGRTVLPRLPGLRGQVIHNDLNPHNVLVDPADPATPRGIIDFGDMVHGAMINDVAIAASYLFEEVPDPLAPVCRFVAAYNGVTPLEREEIDLLPALIATRHALTCAITGWRANRHPGNAAYIVRNRGAAVIGLESLATLGSATAAARLCDACGLG